MVISGLKTLCFLYAYVCLMRTALSGQGVAVSSRGAIAASRSRLVSSVLMEPRAVETETLQPAGSDGSNNTSSPLPSGQDPWTDPKWTQYKVSNVGATRVGGLHEWDMCWSAVAGSLPLASMQQSGTNGEPSRLETPT